MCFSTFCDHRLDFDDELMREQQQQQHETQQWYSIAPASHSFTTVVLVYTSADRHGSFRLLWYPRPPRPAPKKRAETPQHGPSTAHPKKLQRTTTTTTAPTRTPTTFSLKSYVANTSTYRLATPAHTMRLETSQSIAYGYW